jgi:outer membrane protein
MPKRLIRQTAAVALGGALALTSAGRITAALAQAGPAAHPRDDGLTLPLAVEIALSTNPLVRATAAGRELADAQLTEARAGRSPQLQVSQNFTYGNNPVFVFGSLLEQGRFGPQNFALPALNNPDALGNFRTGLALKLPLFDQRQTATRVARAEVRRDQADAAGEQVRQQLRFGVLRAYYGALLARAQKEVADEAVKTGEADVKLSRDRVAAGLAVTSDLLAAEVQLAEFRQQQIQAAGDIVTAQAALNTALGLPLDTPQRVSGALVEKNFDVAAPEELVSLALANRPEIAHAGLSVKSAAEQVRGARGEYLPRLDVFTNFGVSSRNLTSGSSDYAVGASMTFNLFDAGRRARLDQASAAQTLAAAEQEHLTNQIKLEVVRAYQQYVAARERLAVAARVISHATEALRIVQDRYYEGLTTITEVLRAETALVRARLNVLAARHDYYIGYANVLLTSGRLTDVQAFVS